MTNDPEWSPCEPGTLSELAMPIRGQSAQRTRRAALAAMVTVAVGGGLFLLRSEGSEKISCARVAELGPDYVAGILAVEQTTRIDAHRRECTWCDSVLDRLEQQQTQQG